MANKLILFITLLSYSIIVSQPFMYMLSLKYMQMNLSANSYIEMRKLIDAAMGNSFKYVLYATLFATLALVLVNIKEPSGLVFITACIALFTIVVDIVMAVKGSLPINHTINTWSANNYPADWQQMRKAWFDVFFYRQIAAIIGFTGLLVGAIFGK